MEIELPDGTVLEAPDDADVKAVVRGYQRQVGIAKLKEQNPGEYDSGSAAFKRQFSAAPQDKDSFGIIDPATGKQIGFLTPEQREVFRNKSYKSSSLVDQSGKQIKDYTPADFDQLFSRVDNSSKPRETLGSFREGIGGGMLRGWKGLTNLVLPDSLTPDWASDANIQEMDRINQDLPVSGQMVGGLAATAPVSGGVGALQKGATLLSTASRAPAVLTRALGSAPTRAVLEGASQGAIFADPEHQGEGALLGAGLGLGLNRLGAGAKRVLNGTIKKSEEALALEQLASQHGDEIFLPVSQAASDEGIISRLGKAFYREALPIVPGVKGQLERQGNKAAEKLREISVKEALPTGGRLPAQAGKKVTDAIENIQRQFDDAYDQTIKSYAFNVPKDFKQQVVQAIKSNTDPKTIVNKKTLAKVAGEVDDLMKQFSDGKPDIDGSNLLNVKRQISELLSGAKGHEKSAYQAADELIDSIVVRELKQGNIPGNLADLKRYLELTPAYRAFKPLKSAANGAAEKEGRFFFRSLARASKRSPEQRDIGRIGAATVDLPAARGGIVGKILAGAGMGGAGFGAFMSPTMTGLAIAGGNALGTKSAQKFLLGDTFVQKKIADVLRRNPSLARRLGAAGRGALTQQVVSE